MEKTGYSRLLAAAVALASTTLIPSAATAQTATPFALSSVSIAKSEAILGTSRSALADILAKQQGISLATTAPVQPASLRRPTLGKLVTLRPAVSPGVTSGRPDVFGSTALSINRTPLDRRWRAVERSRLSGNAAAFAKGLLDFDPVDRVEAVNRYVNGRVRFVDDSRQFGRADHWMAASETLRRGKGDCEDYAIAKLQMLRAAGIADRDLYLVILKDLVRRSDHAVLVVRVSGRMLMLDNGTDVVADTETVRDYRPMLTFAAGGSWTHGYRRSSAPIQLASATIETPAPAADSSTAN